MERSSRARPLLGTVVAIRAGGAADATLALAMEAAFGAVAQVQRLMSVHDARSDVSRLNRAASGEPVAIHPWTSAVLAAAIGVGRATGFLFDCACAAPLAARGFLPADAVRPGPTGTLADLELRPDGTAVALRPLALDLGGIAKGFAVDRAIEALTAADVPEASVNAGGDLRIYGRAPQPVYVRDPSDPSRVHEIGHCRDVALATSAGYYARRAVGRCHTTPLYDPRTGKLRDQRVSVSVLAASCMLADALTKPVALTGRTDHGWLAGFGARALILT